VTITAAGAAMQAAPQMPPPESVPAVYYLAKLLKILFFLLEKYKWGECPLLPL